MRLVPSLLALTLTAQALAGGVVCIKHSGAADVTAPSDISNLAAGSPTSSTCTLTFSAPYDDTPTSGGAVSSYDCRVCTQAVCSTTMDGTHYTAASLVTNEPIPAAPTTGESFAATISGGLASSTAYTFNCTSVDEASNISGLSNSATCTTLSSITFVQEAHNTGCEVGVSNLVIGTFASNFTVGNTIVVVYSVDTSGNTANCSSATVADTSGNTYTVAASKNNTTNQQCVGMAYAPVTVNSGITPEVTVTFPTWADSRTISVLEYSGVKTTTAGDPNSIDNSECTGSTTPAACCTGVGTGTCGTNGAYTASTATWTSGTITTTVNGDIVIGGVECSSSSTTAHAPGSGFTERTDLWPCRVAVVDQVQTTAGAIQPSGTISGGAGVGNCTGVALALKPQ